MLKLKKIFLEQIITQCQRGLPNEVCGILAGKEGCVEKVYEMVNTANSPKLFFMDAGQQLKVSKEIRTADTQMLGIYHSHTVSQAYPSAHDVEMAFYPDVSYVIISLKDRNKPQAKAFKIVEGKINEEELSIFD